MLGRQEYGAVWQLQHELVEARAQDLIPDTILVVEHEPVITLGRKSPEVSQLQGQKLWLSVPLFLVERGGEATFHGPGQLVIYPIVKLNERLGPKNFLHALERELIIFLKDFGLDCYAQPGATGVWLKNPLERKIASLGISVRNGVTYHGLALNISTDLTYFKKIKPCGFKSEVMTSLMAETGLSPDVAVTGQKLAEQLVQSKVWR